VVQRRRGTHCALRRLCDGDPGGWRHSGWLGARVQDQGPATEMAGTGTWHKRAMKGENML